MRKMKGLMRISELIYIYWFAGYDSLALMRRYFILGRPYLFVSTTGRVCTSYILQYFFTADEFVKTTVVMLNSALYRYK